MVPPYKMDRILGQLAHHGKPGYWYDVGAARDQKVEYEAREDPDQLTRQGCCENHRAAVPYGSGHRVPAFGPS